MPQKRTLALDFDDPIPRHWWADNRLATQLANGINLLFPAGERFFVRSVHHYLDKLSDPVLKEQVQGFFGQEGRHAQAHTRFFEVMTAQGYRIDGFLRLYDLIGYGVIERLASPALRLSATAACEHFTAILAEGALRERLLDRAHPTLRSLLLWHASEELEHKAVAFDVLAQVAPGYATRVAGLCLATVCLSSFWLAATLMLLWQDRQFGPAPKAQGLAAVAQRRGVLARVFGRGIRQYLRRDFHPSQNDDQGLAAEYLASIGATPAPYAPA